MKHITLSVLLFVFIPLLLSPISLNIRFYDHKSYSRIVLEGDQGFEYSYKQLKTNIEIRLNRRVDLKKQVESIRDSVFVDRIERSLEKDPDISVFNIHLKDGIVIKRNFVLEQPFRVVFDLEKDPGKVSKANVMAANTGDNLPDPQIPASQPVTTAPDKEKKRMMISTICLDPGHGGNDFGAVGKSKIMEKDITLKIAARLKKIIESKLGLYVVTTREKDEEISLNSRVAKANNQKAQIFVSIHVNSSFRKSAVGSETYFVSLKATDQDALLLSKKENEASSSDEEKEKFLPVETNNELKMILWNMAQTEYIKESSDLADFIQAELNILLDTANRGVKQAPFRVLMRAAMPAVLVEVAFLSNPSEEKKLQNDEFLNNVANALYTGIAKFIATYNSVNK